MPGFFMKFYLSVRLCEEERRSNLRFVGITCIVQDCFVPRNDALLYQLDLLYRPFQRHNIPYM
jgi:hypothetical protein